MSDRIRNGEVFASFKEFKSCLDSYCMLTGYFFSAKHAYLVETFNASASVKDKPNRHYPLEKNDLK